MHTLTALARLAALVLLCAGQIPAGNKFWHEIAIFTNPLHPDLPLEQYARGQLGIIQPTYARSYLYVAYRLMQGEPFTSEEIEEISRYWTWKTQGSRHAEEPGWSAWLAQRSSAPVPLDEATGDAYSASPERVYYRRCADDAYRVAADTLAARVKQFGAESPEVRIWVVAQDRVFRACVEPAPPLPGPVPDGLAPVIQRDRAYQIAAAHLYLGDYAEARQEFDEIARDRESEWSIWAPYLAGRCLLWSARMEDRRSKKYLSLLDQAAQRFEQVLASGRLKPTHNAAFYLLIRILHRTNPGRAVKMLSTRLRTTITAGSRLSDLQQYTQLLDSVVTLSAPEQQRIRAQDDMTDWILTFQSQEPWARRHAVDRWTKSRFAHWQLAALAKGDLVDVPELHSSHPAYASAQFHRATLLESSGDSDQARTILSDLTERLETSRSSLNAVRSARLKLARDAPEFFRDAVQTPASVAVNTSFGIEYPLAMAWLDWSAEESHVRYPRLSQEAADLMNSSIPLSRLVDLSLASYVPDFLRRQMLLACWVRAALLEQWDQLRTITPHLALAVPELEWRLRAIETAKTTADLRHEVVLILARYPGMSPLVNPGLGRFEPLDVLSNNTWNWWSWWDEERWQAMYPPPEHNELPFVTADGRARAMEEWGRIMQIEDGYTWLLSHFVVEASTTTPRKRTDEGIYLLTAPLEHYNPGWYRGRLTDRARDMCGEAIDLLDKRFPDSPWIPLTEQHLPYWCEPKTRNSKPALRVILRE